MRLDNATLLVSVSAIMIGTCFADEKAHEFYFQQNQQRFVNPA